MNFRQTFWLIGLAAAFAVPVAQSHCTGSSTAQATTPANTKPSTVIQASSKPVGITITGVN